jgi:hypothetical protein
MPQRKRLEIRAKDPLLPAIEVKWEKNAESRTTSLIYDRVRGFDFLCEPKTQAAWAPTVSFAFQRRPPAPDFEEYMPP